MPGQLSPPQWLLDAAAAYDQVFSELFWFLVALSVIYLGGRIVFVPVATRVVRARNRNNPTIVSATETYLQVLVIGFALLTGIIAAGYGHVLVESAVVIAAITFVFGIAGQQVFGSMISGLFLVADPDFNVGDWIEWPGGEGTVEAVDFRVTRVRTPDNETVSVPNTELTNNALTRPYGRNRYRITEQVYVAYDEDVERALLELQQIGANHDAVIEDPAPTARVEELGPNAITIQVELWIEDPGNQAIMTVRSDVRRIVKRRFDEEAITLAPASAQRLSGEVTVREPPGEQPASPGD